jgi:GNAT superfamily N-acetyltransferase
MTAAVARLSRLDCVIRPGRPDDLAFVVDSWTKHAYRGQRMRTATSHVRALLARATSRLVVAHVPDDPESILGWVAGEAGPPLCIHYVYVRSLARSQGVATAMLGTVVNDAADYSTRYAAPPKAWTYRPERAKT